MSTKSDPKSERKNKICVYCKEEITKKKNIFRLTYCCDQCYRKSYAAEKANYAASGHFYPWTIDGKLRTPPRRK